MFQEDLIFTELDGFLRTVDTQPRDITTRGDQHTDSQAGNKQTDSPGSPSKHSTSPRLDKGCSTEDLESVNSEGVAFLQNCFPSVDLSDLQEVLTRCEGDIQWATNILLDTSMEYNEPNKPQVSVGTGALMAQPAIGPVLTSTPGRANDRTSGPARTEAFSFHSIDDSSTIPHSYVNTYQTNTYQTSHINKAAQFSSPPTNEAHKLDGSSNTGDNSRTPPSLAELCHGSLLSSPQALTSPDIQNTFAQGSVRRLQSIEEFRSRQHSESEYPTNEKAGFPTNEKPGNEGTATPPRSSANQPAVSMATPPRSSTSHLAAINPMSPGGTLSNEVFEMLFRQKSVPRQSSEERPSVRQSSQERVVDDLHQSETAQAQPVEQKPSPEHRVQRTPSPPIGKL